MLSSCVRQVAAAGATGLTLSELFTKLEVHDEFVQRFVVNQIVESSLLELYKLSRDRPATHLSIKPSRLTEFGALYASDTSREEIQEVGDIPYTRIAVVAIVEVRWVHLGISQETAERLSPSIYATLEYIGRSSKGEMKMDIGPVLGLEPKDAFQAVKMVLLQGLVVQEGTATPARAHREFSYMSVHTLLKLPKYITHVQSPRVVFDGRPSGNQRRRLSVTEINTDVLDTLLETIRMKNHVFEADLETLLGELDSSADWIDVRNALFNSGRVKWGYAILEDPDVFGCTMEYVSEDEQSPDYEPMMSVIANRANVSENEGVGNVARGVRESSVLQSIFHAIERAGPHGIVSMDLCIELGITPKAMGRLLTPLQGKQYGVRKMADRVGKSLMYRFIAPKYVENEDKANEEPRESSNITLQKRIGWITAILETRDVISERVIVQILRHREAALGYLVDRGGVARMLSQVVDNAYCSMHTVNVAGRDLRVYVSTRASFDPDSLEDLLYEAANEEGPYAETNVATIDSLKVKTEKVDLDVPDDDNEPLSAKGIRLTTLFSGYFLCNPIRLALMHSHIIQVFLKSEREAISLNIIDILKVMPFQMYLMICQTPVSLSHTSCVDETLHPIPLIQLPPHIRQVVLSSLAESRRASDGIKSYIYFLQRLGLVEVTIPGRDFHLWSISPRRFVHFPTRGDKFVFSSVTQVWLYWLTLAKCVTELELEPAAHPYLREELGAGTFNLLDVNSWRIHTNIKDDKVKVLEKFFNRYGKNFDRLKMLKLIRRKSLSRIFASQSYCARFLPFFSIVSDCFHLTEKHVPDLPRRKIHMKQASSDDQVSPVKKRRVHRNPNLRLELLNIKSSEPESETSDDNLTPVVPDEESQESSSLSSDGSPVPRKRKRRVKRECRVQTEIDPDEEAQEHLWDQIDLFPKFVDVYSSDLSARTRSKEVLIDLPRFHLAITCIRVIMLQSDESYNSEESAALLEPFNDNEVQSAYLVLKLARFLRRKRRRGDMRGAHVLRSVLDRLTAYPIHDSIWKQISGYYPVISTISPPRTIPVKIEEEDGGITASVLNSLARGDISLTTQTAEDNETGLCELEIQAISAQGLVAANLEPLEFSSFSEEFDLSLVETVDAQRIAVQISAGGVDGVSLQDLECDSSILDALTSTGRIIAVVGAAEVRYIDHEFSTGWVFPSGAPVGAWRTTKGEINETLVESILRSICCIVIEFPGISEVSMSSQLNALTPGELRRFLDVLVLDGKVTLRTISSPAVTTIFSSTESDDVVYTRVVFPTSFSV